MKKLLIICLFLQLAPTTYSQQYIPFPTNEASWTTVWSWDDAGINQDVVMLFLNGQDTIVNNINYHKLMLRGNYIENEPLATSYISEIPDVTYGFLREEYKKIYFFRYGSDSEQLLYDFTLNVGDPIPPGNSYNFLSSPGNSITSISSITLSNNITYPEFNCNNALIGVYFQPVPGSTEGNIGAYIEGIGSDGGLLSTSTDDYLSSYGGGEEYPLYCTFICFHNNATQATYSPNGYCTYIYPYGTSTSVNNVSIGKELNVYPNPNEGTLTIKASVSGSFSVLTIMGQQVGQYNIKDGETLITLPANLPSGIYISRYRPDDGGVPIDVRIVLER